MMAGQVSGADGRLPIRPLCGRIYGQFHSSLVLAAFASSQKRAKKDAREIAESRGVVWASLRRRALRGAAV